MTLATLLASIAIVVDSQVLIIGAMVLGPEFVPIAALGLALVRRRGTLFGLAVRTLLVGFGVAIALTTVAAFAARALGWVVTEDVTGERPGTDFIYSPDKWCGAAPSSWRSTSSAWSSPDGSPSRCSTLCGIAKPATVAEHFARHHDCRRHGISKPAAWQRAAAGPSPHPSARLHARAITPASRWCMPGRS